MGRHRIAVLPIIAPDGRWAHGDLRIEVTGRDGNTDSSWTLLNRGEQKLPSDVRSYLTSAVLSLTGK